MSDSYTYENTVKIANNIKKNVVNSQKLGENSQWSYFIAKQIISPKKNVEKWYIKSSSNSIGNINSTKIYKKDYMDMAKRLVAYCDSNKQLPNFITYNNNKVNVNDYTYMFARILSYYDINKEYPNYAVVDSNSFKKSTSTSQTNKNTLKPYLTTKGCSGIGQCTPYNCACNSLQQGFYRLTGILVPESTISSWAGTTSSGTSHQGIQTAVAQFNKKYGKNIKITWKNFSDLGLNETARWSALQSYINKGAVFCHLLYRDKYGHYEVPKQVNSANLFIMNSLGDSCGGGTYCGYVETRTKSTQLRYIKGISQKSIAILTN